MIYVIFIYLIKFQFNTAPLPNKMISPRLMGYDALWTLLPLTIVPFLLWSIKRKLPLFSTISAWSLLTSGFEKQMVFPVLLPMVYVFIVLRFNWLSIWLFPLTIHYCLQVLLVITHRAGCTPNGCNDNHPDDDADDGNDESGDGQALLFASEFL